MGCVPDADTSNDRNDDVNNSILRNNLNDKGINKMFLIPLFTWLPWYLNLLITVPIAIFITLAVWRFVVTIIHLLRSIRGILFG
jgi:hypothetical protein